MKRLNRSALSVSLVLVSALYATSYASAEVLCTNAGGSVFLRKPCNGVVGPLGPPEPSGPAGPAGMSDYELVRADSLFDTTSEKFAFATCPATKVLVGGGAATTIATGPTPLLTQSEPSGEDPDGEWFASAILTSGANWQLHAFAICATVGP